MREVERQYVIGRLKYRADQPHDITRPQERVEERERKYLANVWFFRGMNVEVC